MSDRDVVLALENLERMLQEEESLDSETLAAWKGHFDEVLATAERGADWAATVVRARALAKQLDQTADRLATGRDQLRKDLDLQAQGARALKGYSPY